MKNLRKSKRRQLVEAWKLLRFILGNIYEYIITKGYDPNTCSEMASRVVTNRPRVLKSKKERLLLSFVKRELIRHLISKQSRFKLSSLQAFCSLLEFGFVHFDDLGISKESQFSFIRLGRISPAMYKELKMVPNTWQKALQRGLDRREDLRRQTYDRLMNKRFNFVFVTLEK